MAPTRHNFEWLRDNYESCRIPLNAKYETGRYYDNPPNILVEQRRRESDSPKKSPRTKTTTSGVCRLNDYTLGRFSMCRRLPDDIL